MDDIYQLIIVLRKIILDNYRSCNYDGKYEYIHKVTNKYLNPDIWCKIEDIMYGLNEIGMYFGRMNKIS